MDQNQSKRIGAHLAGELATALCSEFGEPVDVEAALEQPGGAGFLLTVKCEGAASGNIIAWVVDHVAEAAARTATASEAPTQEDVLSIVRQRAEVAVANLAGVNDCAGLKLIVTGVVPGNPPAQGGRFRFLLPSGAKGSIAVLTHLSGSETGTGAGTGTRGSNNLDLVLDVELPLVVRFGRTVMNLKTLTGLGPGSIVDMGRSPDDPVELLVSDKVVAYGEVVIVDGSYGLRITEIVSRGDRARTLEVR